MTPYERLTPAAKRILTIMERDIEYTPAALRCRTSKTLGLLARAGYVIHTNPGAEGEKTAPKFVKKYRRK